MGWREDGGAYTPEAWLMDVCSAMMHGEPKTAVHCCDMALNMWVDRSGDRNVLHFVRGLVVADHVGDPLRAVDDLEQATHGPDWLRDEANNDLARVNRLAAGSRVKVARVGPAPAYDPDYVELIWSLDPTARPPAPDPMPVDGERPELWDRAMRQLREPARRGKRV